jgi:hypothetical protein
MGLKERRIFSILLGSAEVKVEREDSGIGEEGFCE